MPHATPVRLLKSLAAGWLWLFFFVGATALAQRPVPLSHQAWSTEEGLPSASVHQVFQSAEGYLWLATEGGVARFDGFTFRNFRHENQPVFTSDDVSAIAQDRSGTLWFGTADGLIQLRGNVWRHFAEPAGLPSSTILALAAPGDGSLLVLTSRGLARERGDVFSTLPVSQETVTALQPAPDGAVDLITAAGVQRYHDDRITRQPLPRTAPADPVLGIQFAQNTLWIRFARSVFLQTSGLERTLKAGSDIPASRLTTLYVDRHGTGWIGTRRGLFTLRPEPGSKLQAVDSLRLDSILSVTEDREGNLWIGTETSGLHALRPRKFRTEPAAAGEAVSAGLTASDGRQWYGTRDDGIREVVGNLAEQPVPASRLTSPVVLSMAPGPHADLWIGTPDGLNHVLGKTVEQYTSSNGLPDDFIRSLLVDAHGALWAGTRRGLVHMEQGRITTLTQASGLGSDSIGPLLEARTSANPAATPVDLWIGTSGGLTHLLGSRLRTFSPYADHTRVVVTALAQDGEGSLWVGLHAGGLSHFTAGHFTPIRNQELPAEITALLPDAEGHLWIRGPQGVYRVALDDLRACARLNSTPCPLHVASYSTADGLPSEATTAQGMPSLWRAANGDLCFATRKGIALADPAHLPENQVPPPVVIERFLADNTDVPLGPGESRIPPGHNRYTFEYAALSFTLPTRNRYRYLLEGFDKNWLDAGASRTASYTSLPPHHYRFRVQAQNNDGVWNETGAELRFDVLPAFYRRWWFYALVLCGVASLAFALFQLRLRVVQRRFSLVLQERNRVAREIHDTLAQDFVSVSLQLDLASQLLRANDTEQALTQLQATRQLVKEGLEAARQSIWNLRANTAADSLPTLLSAVVQRYREPGPPPHLRVGGAFRPLAPAVEGDVLRIAQESLANTYRHAEATEVSVQLHYEAELLRLDIRDNGRGFQPDTAQHLEGHYGLRGMTERAAALGATLTIASTPGKGATVTLLVPLSGKRALSPEELSQPGGRFA